MLLKFLLLFTLVPILEVFILIQVSGQIGAVPTILIVALTGFIGVFLAKAQGFYTIYRFRNSLERGGFPTQEIFDGACILVGSAFLLTPGLITDILGFSLLLPQTRSYIKKYIQKIIEKMIIKGDLRIRRQ